jgi:glycerate 2-kinase
VRLGPTEHRDGSSEVVSVRIVVAPDGFGGVTSAAAAARAIAEGWGRARPSDVVELLPLSDGGEGLLDVVGVYEPKARRTSVEVAGADSRPRLASLHWSDAQTVVLESADVCGLATVPPDHRRPTEATTYGIGQLLQAAVDAGARRIVVGLGGTATVDGGSGALNGLGFRLRTADGAGLRIGAADLHGCVSVEDGWTRWPRGEIELEVLADVDAVLGDAVPLFGPQKGLGADQVRAIGAAVDAWGALLCTTYPGMVDVTTPGTGAAGGLGLALAVALGGQLRAGAGWVAELAGLPAALGRADLVITGEGRLDPTSARGKVVGHVLGLARASGTATALVVGQIAPGGVESVGVPAERVVTAPVSASDPAAASALRRAGETLARRLTSVH